MYRTIFTWFGNLPTSTKLQGFHYYQGRIQSGAIIFFLSKKHSNNTHNKTLITKLRFLHKTGPKNFLGGVAPGSSRGLSISASAWVALINLLLKITQHYFGRVGSGYQTGSNKTRLHKAQQY